jgi:hypothetical protein
MQADNRLQTLRNMNGPPLKTSIAKSAWLAMLPILAVATGLRLQAINFGLPALNDPDELMFELGAVKMLRELSLNPGWFGHPATTTMYALALVNAGVFAVGSVLGWFPDPQAFARVIYDDPTWAILPGRLLMAVFGLLCVWATYRLASRIFDRWIGLGAAALIAMSPVHITYSQIIRSDMQACFFMLMCLSAAVDVRRRGMTRDYLIAAVWLGLSIATKWPFAIAGLAIAGATILRSWDNPEQWRGEARKLVLFAGAALATLFIVSPYLLLDYPTVLRNLQGEAQPHHLGSTGGGLLWNLGWYLRGPLYDGLGPVGLVLAVIGLGMAVRRAEYVALLGSVTIAFLFVISAQTLIWERWSLPLLTLLAIPAVLPFAAAWRWLVQPSRRRWALAASLSASVLIAGPMLVQSQERARERAVDTRQLASAWARRNIPAGSSVLIEHYAFDLIAQPWSFLFPLGSAGCLDAVRLLKGKVSYSLIDRAREGRSNLDYGTIDPGRVASCRTDYAILTQYDRYRAERDVFSAEYRAYSQLLRRGRLVATFAPKPGSIGGPIVRIVAF